ncbi:pyruvate dehydrogenase E1 component beta subunit [Inquilinus ginsengisoli]|uniref:Pyruvate dehydrogenase E1 component beta subunit n=1 Tax=Inquilinus ginsengisoli TaxID=363840 RepID=A0ABU1JSE1_9PROT|nr:alpha-ketoacid dehydrogenase subunit beta [Inquilinus ginsengisoli]MDR6291528.1 pyruvate dehydrogenase E1 component beta subunit [Inquilinus ginsengisoli]
MSAHPAEITYRDALRLALREAMAEDPAVIVLGEEVGRYGGAYGVTKGLLEEFGAERVRDAPISEAIIVGAAIGAAMTGLRPVAELMYVDFIGLAMDQVANQAAKIRSMFGGQIGVPMVLRTQGGTGRSAAAQHSQSLEAWILHVPGLRLAMPATATDAYVLLRQALKSPDPVVFIEHKGLYTRTMPFAPDEALPWGKAAVRRPGRDLTIVTYSRMVFTALEAAETLAGHGIEAEVIDLRTLNPLDHETMTASLRRTGRAIVLTEDALTGGVSAELSARLQEGAFDFLEEPILRLAGEDVPIPVAPGLEQAAIPQAAGVVAAARRLLRR